MQYRQLFLSTIAALCSCASAAFAFGPVIPSPVMTAGGGAMQGQILLPQGVTKLQLDQNLLAALPQSGSFTLVGFPLDNDRVVDLELEYFEPFSPTADLRVGYEAEDGTWVQEPGDHRPTAVCYRGVITDQIGSRVFLSFSTNSNVGLIVNDQQENFSIADGQANNQGPLLITNLSKVADGVMNWNTFTCTTPPQDIPAPAQAMPPADGMPRSLCRMLEMAIDTDNELYKGFASNKSDEMNYLTQQMGAFCTVYYQELNIDAQLTFARICVPSRMIA